MAEYPPPADAHPPRADKVASRGRQIVGCCAQPGNPRDIGRPHGAHLRRPSLIVGPSVLYQLRGISDNAGRARHGGTDRVSHRRKPGRHQAPSARTEQLHVDLIVSRIDDGKERPALVRFKEWRRQRRQRCQTDRGLAGRQRDAAGSRHADAQAGEAARPDRDGDAIEIEKFNARPRSSQRRSAASGLPHDRASSALTGWSCRPCGRYPGPRRSRPRAPCLWREHATDRPQIISSDG